MPDYDQDLVKSMRPLPSNWDQLTKDQLAFARIPDWQYDTALPQEWLNAQAAGDDKKYAKLLTRTVWVYPPGSPFGMALDLIDGRIPQ
jgi:hypothetical protein